MRTRLTRPAFNNDAAVTAISAGGKAAALIKDPAPVWMACQQALGNNI